MFWFMQFLSKLIQREFSHYVFLNTAFSARTKISASERNLSKNIHDAPVLLQSTNEMENKLCLVRINILSHKEL